MDCNFFKNRAPNLINWLHGCAAIHFEKPHCTHYEPGTHLPLYLIFWSPLAEETFLKTLSFILEKWTIKEAEAFEQKVENLLKKITTQKRLCPPSDKQINLRRYVITPQTSLVYEIRDGIIEIVSFFDNRSEHHF